MPKKSDVWNHFTRLTDDNGNFANRARCNSCPNKEFDTKGGTTNMWKHYKKFHGQDDDVEALPPPPPSAPSRLGGSSLDGKSDMAAAKSHLAEMIVLSGYDPSIVDDYCFRSFVKSLNPAFRVPSRVDIEEKCSYILWKAIMEDLFCKMEDPRTGRISLAVGKAKKGEVIYIAYHFIDYEWNLHKMIRDATTNPVCFESHVVIGVRMITNYFFSTGHEEFAENLFMVAWGITNDHSKLKGYINQNLLKRKLVCTTFVDSILHSVGEHLFLNINSKFSSNISEHILLLSREQKELLSHVGVDHKEAWYLSYYFLLILREGYAGTSISSGLTRLLSEIWGAIHRAIQRISASSGPTSNICLIQLFNVRNVLESEMALASGANAYLYEGCFVDNKDVTTVLTELRDILDKAIQESYLVWSIPLILDPQYNLNFVKSIFGGAFREAADNYIFKLTANIKELYLVYANEQFESPLEREKAQAEFDLYLMTSRLVPPTEDYDVLDWWKVHGSDQYPTVALMARDALAMPTCSQLSSDQIAHVNSFLRGYSKTVA